MSYGRLNPLGWRMVTGRQEDDRDIGVGSDQPAPMETVILWELNMNNDQIWFVIGELLKDLPKISYSLN
jgi:hypothetical protein